MAPRSPWLHSRPADRATRRGAGGQMLVLFALALMSMIAVAGLLMDAGAGWVVRREAQAAADTAALAAAKVAGRGNVEDAFAAAASIADANGFDTAYIDCSGTPRSDGVVLNIPPATSTSSRRSPSYFVNCRVHLVE